MQEDFGKKVCAPPCGLAAMNAAGMNGDRLTFDSLAGVRRWVAWQTERNAQGRITKVPYSPEGGYAKANDPRTWGTRVDAQARAERLPKPFGAGGVGFQLGDLGNGLAIGGLDCDTCRDPKTGTLELWAADVVSDFGSYCEVSPSFTGVKVFFCYDPTELPGLVQVMGTQGGKKWTCGKGEHPPSIELYVTGRYFAVTGQRLETSPIGLHIVPRVKLECLIRHDGPAFAQRGKRDGQTDGAGAGSVPDWEELLARLKLLGNAERLLAGDFSQLNDSSRSGVAMAMCRALKRGGFTFDEAAAFLRGWEHTADWCAEKGELNNGRELRRAWERCRAPPPQDDSKNENSPQSGDRRSIILWRHGCMEKAVNEAELALIMDGRSVYQRGGLLVGVGEVPIPTSNGEVIGQRIIPRGDYALAEDLSTVAVFKRFDKRSGKWVPIDVPMQVVKTLQQRTGRWTLWPLAGVINAPLIRSDGSILGKPGYDAQTGLLFDPRGITFPTIPEKPTRSDAEAALVKLSDLVKTFPFVSPASRSVALSAMLTACARRSLPTAPLHGFTAPVAGSGKSMLVDITSVLATGRRASVIAQGKSEEEMEKRLGAMLLAGDAVIAIDNCEEALGGELLCQLLTQHMVRVRILGRSETPELPTNAFVAATGNGLTLAGDMVRRSLLCRIDPQCERPENRKFDRDPVATVLNDRGAYVAAALTVLRSFHVAGRPQQRTPLGSFEVWSHWVRDALVWLGQADPAETMEEVRALDPKLRALEAVLAQWEGVLGTERISVRKVIERATERSGSEFSPPSAGFRHPEFLEALRIVAGRNGAIDSDLLGKWLRTNQDRRIEERRIIRDGVLHGATMWRLSVEKQTCA